jgi:hypothetical protein
VKNDYKLLVYILQLALYRRMYAFGKVEEGENSKGSTTEG